MTKQKLWNQVTVKLKNDAARTPLPVELALLRYKSARAAQ